MNPGPRWFLPVAVIALIWNLLGCAAYLTDATLSEEDIAGLTPAEQELRLNRPSWTVSATATAVWAGAAGCLGLILRKRWAAPSLYLSLAGIIAQDIWLFILSDAAAQSGAVVYVMQGLVLLIGAGLILLTHKASAAKWIT